MKSGLLNRLSRIEGQVRGITRMVEEERYCIDVLTQLQAVRAALARVETEMLKSHLHHCIEGAIVSGDAKEQRKKAGELIELLGRASRGVGAMGSSLDVWLGSSRSSREALTRKSRRRWATRICRLSELGRVCR